MVVVSNRPALDVKECQMTGDRKKIVVVGGGFGGLNFLKKLANHPLYDIALVDINNYHLFPPLLYQVGMALIEPTNIIYPFRRFFQKRKNIRFHMSRLVRVNPEVNSIQTESCTLHYDYLILAVGTESNYFGIQNVQQNSWPLKTIDDATNLRNHLLLNIEKAVQSDDEAERKRLLTVVIAGGGPAGVEVAGMLAEMVHTIGPKEYPEIRRGTFRIYLVQGSSELLKTMSKKAQAEALHELTKLRIEVILDTRVVDYADGKVILNTGNSIPTNALIWTSGVIGREVHGLPSECYGYGRRLKVDEYLTVKGTKNIFAIGDISLSTGDPQYPDGYPQLAQVAIQQGTWIAGFFKKTLDKNQWKPFRYADKGTMAIISKYEAVADLPKVFFKGFGAWLVWLFVHLIPLAGFRNKFNLASSWAWAFITDNPTLRLIIRPQKENPPREDAPHTNGQMTKEKEVTPIQTPR